MLHLWGEGDLEVLTLIEWQALYYRFYILFHLIYRTSYEVYYDLVLQKRKQCKGVTQVTCNVK